MNKKPEVGTYPRPDGSDADTEGRGPMEKPWHGPPAGWRVATLASGFLVLSVFAGVVSLLAGMLLILPLAILALPFVLHQVRVRKGRRRPAFPWSLSGLRRT
jgi:hypothetical protein